MSSSESEPPPSSFEQIMNKARKDVLNLATAYERRHPVRRRRPNEPRMVDKLTPAQIYREAEDELRLLFEYYRGKLEEVGVKPVARIAYRAIYRQTKPRQNPPNTS